MVFKQVGNDTDKLINKFGILNKSFANIKMDFQNGQGIRSLGNIVSKQDIANFEKFQKDLQNGISYHKAFNNNLANSHSYIQQQASSLRELITQRNLLNRQLRTGKITQEEYNTAITANQAQIQTLTNQTKSLTVAQRLATATSKALSIGLNLIGNIAIAAVINLIITGITKLVNKEKELAETAKESADTYKEQSKSLDELKKKYQEICDSEVLETEKIQQLNDLKQELIDTYGFTEEALRNLNLEREKGIELLENEIRLANQSSRGEWLGNNKEAIDNANKKIKYQGVSSGSTDGIVKAMVLSNGHTNLDNISSDIKNMFEDISYEASGLLSNMSFKVAGDDMIEKYEQIQKIISELGNMTKRTDEEEYLLELLNKEASAMKKVLDVHRANYETNNQFTALNLFDNYELINSTADVGKESYISWRDGLLATAEGDTALEKELLSLAEQQFPDYAKYFENLNKAKIQFGATKPNSGFDALKKSLLEQLTNEQLEVAIQIPDLFSNGSFDGTLKSITDRIEAWNKANGNLEIKFNYAEYSEQVDDVVKNIDKLQSALDNLTGGKSLETKDITELANSFPDYSTKILSAANSTEELKLVLTDIKRNAPKSLINTLENLSGLSKQDQEAVNGLISVLTTVNSKTSTYADTLADLETKESLLSSVYKEMHDDGQISISTYQKLIEMGDDYANMVTVVNGKLTVNTQDLKELTKKKYEDEIATLKLTKAELGYNIASNPQNYSLYAEKISAINADIEAKEKALELLNGFDYTDDDKKESDDPWKDKAEAKIAEIQHLEAMNKITHEQYIDELDKINQKYYANNEKYLTEFNKYDEEVFKGRKELAEKAFDDIIDGIEKEIDALDKLKDNASLDINAEGSIYSIIDQQILLYQQAIDEIGKRIAELEASGLVGIEDEIEELNKQKDDLLEKVYDLGKERTSTGIENEISYWEEMQSKQNDFYDKQIEKLKKQKELLEDKNDEEERAKDLAEKQLELRKAQIALEDARRNRNVLVYTAGGGYSYEADQTAIAEAEADVKKAKEDLEELRQEEIKDNLDKQIEILEEQKDKDSEYYDTIIKLLEDMSGKNKVQSESNRSIWGQLLATDAGQKALAQIDPDKLQELLDSGFLVKKDGKYSLGEKKPNDEKVNEVFKTGTDVISMLSKLLHKSESEIKSNDKLMNAVTNGGFNSLAMPSQSALSELTKTKGTMVTNYNNSKISNTYHVDKIDIGYSGDDFNDMLGQAFNAMNQQITINGNKVAYGN